MRRNRVVVSEDEDEDEVVCLGTTVGGIRLDERVESEMEDDAEFSTPPSTPTKENVRTVNKKNGTITTANKSQPRSLVRLGRTLAVRQVYHMESRLAELRGFPLTRNESFFMSEWNFEAGPRDVLDAEANTPKQNASILLKRALALIAYFQANFERVSYPYFGKTINLRSRFNNHLAHKSRDKEMIALLTLTVMSEHDIPSLDKERCEHTVDSWGCTMERLVISAARQRGLLLYEGTSEVGGGGKAGADDNEHVTIYLLLSVSNDPL